VTHGFRASVVTLSTRWRVIRCCWWSLANLVVDDHFQKSLLSL